MKGQEFPEWLLVRKFTNSKIKKRKESENSFHTILWPVDDHTDF
jgi:hypothetical protein